MRCCRLALLLLVLVCAACSDDNGGRGGDPSPIAGATASTTASASASVTALPTATAAPTGTVDAADGSVEPAPFGQDSCCVTFASPTGNLTCAVYQEAAECRAQEHTWQEPPEPPEPPECYETGGALPNDPGEWGRLRVSGEADGQASFFRGTDPLDPTQHVLQYGKYVRVGAVQCESRRDGLTCRNIGSGHGFTLSRDKVSLF